MMSANPKQLHPNHVLRQQRLKRGWTLERAADELYKLCGPRANKRGDINAKMIGSWERGEHPPSLFYQEKLSFLYGKSPQELGFLKQSGEMEKESDVTLTTSDHLPFLAPLQQLSPIHLTPTQAIDHLNETPLPQQQLGAWLTLGASHLATLFDDGWSLEEVLDSLRIVLQGVQAMPSISRRTFARKLLELGAAAIISSVPIPTGKYISAEEGLRLHQALGENIAASWQLFHTAGNAQVLAVGYAQLQLVQQVHSNLNARDRSMFYSAIYDLIGKTLFFQEHYNEALEAHQSAYIAALQAGDPWRVTQSLICQSDGYQALGQHVEAIQSIEQALRVIGTPTNEEQFRSKAHLYACWADNAMSLGEELTVQRKMEASAMCLEQLSPNEEFDRGIWLQFAGKFALQSGDYLAALRHYEAALAELSPNWIVRQVLVLIPLMVANACKHDREASMATADKAASVLSILNAPGLNKQFASALQRGLLASFPRDKDVRTFISELPKRYPVLKIGIGLS